MAFGEACCMSGVADGCIAAIDECGGTDVGAALEVDSMETVEVIVDVPDAVDEPGRSDFLLDWVGLGPGVVDKIWSDASPADGSLTTK